MFNDLLKAIFRYFNFEWVAFLICSILHTLKIFFEIKISKKVTNKPLQKIMLPINLIIGKFTLILKLTKLNKNCSTWIYHV